MLGDSLTNNALLFFPFSFFLKFGIRVVLNSSSPSSNGVIQSLKIFTAAESKIFNIQSSFSNREWEEGGKNETLPCKMSSSCNDDKSVLRMQKIKATWDLCFLREAFSVGGFLLLGGGAQFLFRGEPLGQGELKCFSHTDLRVDFDKQLKFPLFMA